jgi:hypothetical protein
VTITFANPFLKVPVILPALFAADPTWANIGISVTTVTLTGATVTLKNISAGTASIGTATLNYIAFSA